MCVGRWMVTEACGGGSQRKGDAKDEEENEVGCSACQMRVRCVRAWCGAMRCGAEMERWGAAGVCRLCDVQCREWSAM